MMMNAVQHFRWISISVHFFWGHILNSVKRVSMVGTSLVFRTESSRWQ